MTILIPKTFADVSTAYKKFKSNCENDTDIYLPGGQFVEEGIVDAIKQLKRRKACGNDKVQNEYVIYGGPKTVKCLTVCFNLLVKLL